ncbi:MAG: hypothetical protein K0U93_18190 [Gammaproteobacteria bacterium]|nr:hypothetical protein [Gammaproteobacteria bacterium]
MNMRRLLGSRGTYERFAFDSSDDIDVDEMATLATDAWAADYVDVVRPDFPPAVLRRLMGGSGWFGVGVWLNTGEMVGYELALPRVLLCRGVTLNAYYVTAFTVSSAHRRHGLGRWILEGINSVAFAERGTDIVFSTFHQGHAGSPTVQATFDQIDDWAVNRFHQTAIWTRRLDRGALSELDERVQVTRLALANDVLTAVSTGAPAPWTAAELEHAIEAGHDVSFSLSGQFASSYLSADEDGVGSLWIEINDDAWAFVPYVVQPLTTNTMPAFKFGQVQGIFGRGLNQENSAQVLTALLHFFRGLGCMAAGIFDTGGLAPAALRGAGLELDDDRYYYAVRGPTANISLFDTVRPPYFIDFS